MADRIADHAVDSRSPRRSRACAAAPASAQAVDVSQRIERELAGRRGFRDRRVRQRAAFAQRQDSRRQHLPRPWARPRHCAGPRSERQQPPGVGEIMAGGRDLDGVPAAALQFASASAAKPARNTLESRARRSTSCAGASSAAKLVRLHLPGAVDFHVAPPAAGADCLREDRELRLARSRQTARRRGESGR